MPKIPKLDPNKVAVRAMDKFMEDPLAVMVQTDTYLDAASNFAPVMPWEFPFPIPRGVYNRLNLKDFDLTPK